jgi:hypothetical protein
MEQTMTARPDDQSDNFIDLDGLPCDGLGCLEHWLNGAGEPHFTAGV